MNPGSALRSFPQGGQAVVVGASGAIGKALLAGLKGCKSFSGTVGLSRKGPLHLDLTSEQSIAAAARHVAGLGTPPRLVIDATGFLHGNGAAPEKSWRRIDPQDMAHAFAINAIGPALLMKYFLPLLPREGKSVFATLSAKVGSIGDNRSGGWYSYRASKAALNQIVRTGAIELRRQRPAAVCVALHPGTVESPLSAPFSKAGLAVRQPADASADLLAVIDGLSPDDSGGFLDYRGEALPW